ncbi:hypothetical protein Q8A73_000085 [Channa argus]|nr:hypothetical protein Q8A73_000085 [Channa argus]
MTTPGADLRRFLWMMEARLISEGLGQVCRARYRIHKESRGITLQEKMKFKKTKKSFGDSRWGPSGTKRWRQRGHVHTVSNNNVKEGRKRCKGTDQGNREKCPPDWTEIMVCIGGTCSASSFSSCLLFHLTAKIKAYNQILLIGPKDGDWPTGSLPAPFLYFARLQSAGNDNEPQAVGTPVSQDSGLLQWTLPADSQLVVIFAACRRPDLAISSLLPQPRLPPIDRPE